MLDILNGLDEPAWAGLTALALAIIGAIGAVLKGLRRHRDGTAPPVADPIGSLIAEIHRIGARQNDIATEADRRFDRIDRDLARIHTDTQVIRERQPPR